MATSLELAITAIRSNRKDEGRQLLNLLIQENPNNEMAWLWMSSVVNTDEQRARCLYHVLAINPDNYVARRGLQLLGIVVSDSRPVKVPRDSQPIKIPKPSPPHTQFIPYSQPANPPTDTQPLLDDNTERRPFRLDPQTVVDELPFKPITKPFTTADNPSPAPTEGQGQQATVAPASTPVPVAGMATTEQPASASVQPQTQAVNPSQPVPVVQNNTSPGTGPLQPAPMPQPPTDSRPMPPISDQPMAQYYPPQAQTPQQFPAGAFPQDTRPSEPVPVVSAPSPSQPMPMIHSNATMGMPMQQLPPGYSQPMAPVHSNVTMGMPAPAQGNGQMAHPSEPVPVHSNTTMGMPSYQQPQYQQPMPQNYAAHSNSTTMMPVGAAPFAAPPQQQYQVANTNGTQQQNQTQTDDTENGDDINILAVIIFGSLSVTALGGLGMLILLMFAT